MKKLFSLFSVFVISSSLLYAAAPKKTDKIEKTEKAQGEIILDNFEDISTWKTSSADGVTIKTSLGKGETGSALVIDYDLKETKQWAAVEKKLEIVLPATYTMKILLRASGNVNNLEFKFVDDNDSNFGYKTSLDVSNKWKEIVLTNDDINYWWGGDEILGPIKKIYFAVSNLKGGKGRVEINKLILIPNVGSGAKLSAPGVLDDFEKYSGWLQGSSDGADLTVKVVPGKDNNAIEIDYDLGDINPSYVFLEKAFNLDIEKNKVLKFWVKAEGARNKLEVKLVDKDGSIFGKMFEDLKPEWEEIIIPISELGYLWGGNDKLEKPIKVGIAISNIEGGKGKISLDKLQLTK